MLAGVARLIRGTGYRTLYVSGDLRMVYGGGRVRKTQ